MYAYKIIGSADFQRLSVDIYAIKSGADVKDKENFYIGYAEWLNGAIPELISGKGAYVTAAKNGDVVAYMAYSECENAFKVSEINAKLPSESFGNVLQGMCACIAKERSCKKGAVCFIFDNEVKIPQDCIELVACGVVGRAVKYRYREIEFKP